MAERTAIRGGTIIAFDGTEHRQLEDGVLVFEGDRIVHVGRSYQGPAQRTIDATGKLVIPGLISTHAHVGLQEGGRFLVDGGRRDFLRSGFLNYLPMRKAGGPSFLAKQDARASLQFGFASLLRHGVTTVVPFAPGGSDNGGTMVRTAGEMGLRIYYAPLATGGRYVYDEEGRVELLMDENLGLGMLEKAAEFIREFDGACDGRVRPIIVLDEYYVSTPALRRRAKELAERSGLRLTLHFAEQLREFFETVTRTGRTPLQLLADEGFLGPQVILAHCLYLAGHSLVNYPFVDDLEILAASGASIAHSPAGIARRGLGLESFQRFLDRGVNIALATDAYPLDLFSEMRMTALACKLLERNHEAADAMAVFRAATLGGARALGRDDLGRLAPGAKADIVLLDVENLQFGVNPDPIRALVHLATGNMVDTVIVDGRTLVADGQLLVCNERELLRAMRASSQRVWEAFPTYHWAGQSVEEVFPPCIRTWEE
jgi:cytosine/adenosine deaminase-related metal-dependent hydrolase